MQKEEEKEFNRIPLNLHFFKCACAKVYTAPISLCEITRTVL